MWLIIMIIFILGEILSGLVIMGLVNLLCWAFGIAFTLSFIQGLAIALVITFISTLFRKDEK